MGESEEPLKMDKLVESTYHLLGGHDDSLDAELPAAHVEQVFE